MTALAISTGNRCGHVPAKPVLDPIVELHAKAPPILRDAIKKVRAFYAQPETMPYLNHDDRQRRSESRESIVVVLNVLLKHLDLVTMKLQQVTAQGSRLNPSIKYLHAQSGLSLSRFKRAWLALIDSGLINSFKQHEKTEKGDYKGLPSIKTVTPLLFKALNMAKRLKHTRDYLSEKQRLNKAKKLPMQEAIQQIRNKGNAQRVKKVLTKAGRALFPKINKNIPAPPPPINPPNLPFDDRIKQMQAKHSK